MISVSRHRIGLLALLCCATLHAQVRTSSQSDAESVNRQARAFLRPDLGYVAKGWKKRNKTLDRVAEAQERAVMANPEAGTLLLTNSRAKGFANLTREEVLRCFVTMHYVRYAPLTPRDLRALFDRSNAWAFNLSFEEFQWRTFATWGIARDPAVIVPIRIISNAVPNDWRTAVVLISALLGRRNTAQEALTKARHLASLYPKHVGTIAVLADTLTVRAYQLRDVKLLDEAAVLLRKAQSLPASSSEKWQVEKVRSDIAYYKAKGFR